MISIRHIVAAVLLLAQGLQQLLQESHDFSELEQGVQRLSQEVSAQLLRVLFEALDRELMAKRKQSLRLIGTRVRKIITLFGTLKIERRLYRDEETGKCVFLLDEMLGLPAYARLSSNLEKICCLIGLEVPFRRAADIIGLLVPRVSGMTVWKRFQEAGKEAAKQAKDKREAVFEDGVVPEGTRRPQELNIEADGVAVNLQRAATRRGEVRLVVAYEGKENVGTQSKPRRVLRERHQVAGFISGKEIWEEASAAFGGIWDLSSIPSIRIGGDGAEWVKDGQQYFKNATYHLDPFHLKKRVTEALGQDSDARRALASALQEGCREKVEEVLRAGAKARKGQARQRVKSLASYILSNWDGIQAALDGPSLGTIEGHNWHIIARRMKRRGARWGVAGADYMSRLLALREEGNLEGLCKTRSMDTEKLATAIREVVEKNSQTRTGAKEVGDWLRASIPALRGPFAGDYWVKHVLRVMAEAGYTA